MVSVHIVSLTSNLSCPCPFCSTYTDLCFIYMIPIQFLEQVKKFSHLRIFAYTVPYPGTFFLQAPCLTSFFSNSKTQFIWHLSEIPSLAALYKFVPPLFTPVGTSFSNAHHNLQLHIWFSYCQSPSINYKL